MLVAKTILKKLILITAGPEVGNYEVKAIACSQSHCVFFMIYVHIWTDLPRRARLSVTHPPAHNSKLQ